MELNFFRPFGVRFRFVLQYALVITMFGANFRDEQARFFAESVFFFFRSQ
jgi:hypothetical protein